jgi:hypothetical protein
MGHMKLSIREIKEILFEIASGSKIVNVGSDFYILKNPDILILTIAEKIYSIEYEKSKKSGLLSETELFQILKDRKIWGDIEEANLNDLIDKIRKLRKLKMRYDLPSQKIQMESQIERLIKQYSELYRKKYIFFIKSAEFYSKDCKTGYLLSNSTYFIEGRKKWETFEEFKKEKDIKLVNVLQTEFEVLDFTYEEQILRQIARSSEGRLLWNISKKTGDLFKGPVTEWSKPQRDLGYWFNFYDYVYESLEKPPAEVIDNDALLDEFIEAENLEYEAKQNKNYGGKRPLPETGDVVLIGAAAKDALTLMNYEDKMRKIKREAGGKADISDGKIARNKNMLIKQRNIDYSRNKGK